MTEQDTQLTAQTAASESASASAAETSAEAPATSEAPAKAKREAQQNQAFLELQPGQELTGKVKSLTPYGAFININVGRDGLVHISELANARVEKVEDVVQVGQEVTVRVLEVDHAKGRISLTMRTEPRPARAERRRPEVNTTAIAALKAGDIVEGVVKSIQPIGAFIDIGVGKDGLVHISELSETRVEKVEDAVKIGEGYSFKVLEVDVANGRISLSLRKAQSKSINADISVGQIMSGKVSGHAPFGVFVNIGVGRDGLVHVSEIPGGQKPAEGSEIQVRIINVDTDNNRISLSAYLEPRPEGEERPARTERPARAPRADGEERPARRERREGGNRKPESYTSSSFGEEVVEGNATIDDLLSRFGGAHREKRARNTDAQYEDGRKGALPRDVIRRTLNIGDDE
ncbi:MAG: S1 RNA-binding domain-containing protein [Roseiflexaceae bacterium]